MWNKVEEEFELQEPDVSPLLSIGLPVFNGERFLGAAIQSILNQSYADFELILSDNGSTDATRQICLYHASRDRRVRYYRSKANLGACKNFNHVVHRARGRYFKWAAHDDVCLQGYLKGCIDVLEEQQDVISCHSMSMAIDAKGEKLGVYGRDRGCDQTLPSERFREMICTPHMCLAIFGVMRREPLLQTPLLQPYVGSDRNLLAELSLMGRIHFLPRVLFARRDHPGTSVRRFTHNEKGWVTWFDPSLKDTDVSPMTTTVLEYTRSLERVSLDPQERQRCRTVLEEWIASGKDYQGRPVQALLDAEAAEA